jgi:hypothetical protein
LFTHKDSKLLTWVQFSYANYALDMNETKEYEWIEVEVMVYNLWTFYIITISFKVLVMIITYEKFHLMQFSESHLIKNIFYGSCVTNTTIILNHCNEYL